jgi:hypothetical protein
MGIIAGQKHVFYARTQQEYKGAPTKQNNTIACCLVGDSGHCKANPNKVPTKPLFVSSLRALDH